MAKRSRVLASDSDSDDEPLADRLTCKPEASQHGSKLPEPQPGKSIKEECKNIKKKNKKKRQEQGLELQQGQQQVPSDKQQEQQGEEQHVNLEHQDVKPHSKKHKAKHSKRDTQPEDVAVKAEPNGHVSKEINGKQDSRLGADAQAQQPAKKRQKKKKQGQEQEEQGQQDPALPQQQDAPSNGTHVAVSKGRRGQKKEATESVLADANGTQVQPQHCKEHEKGRKRDAHGHVPNNNNNKDAMQTPSAQVADQSEEHYKPRRKKHKTAAADEQLPKSTNAAHGNSKGAKQQQTTPSAVGSQPAAPSQAASDLWYKRCRRIILNCLESDCYEVIARSLVTWEAAEVMALVTEWTPHTFAAVFASFPANKLAELLQHSTPERVAAACESWPVEQLVDVLPLLRSKTVRQVLRLLYFNSSDPYLTIVDAKHILMAMPDHKRNKVCRKLKRKTVNKVLDADEHAADSLNEDDDYGSEIDGSYDSSFVVSDEDDVEEGEEVDAYAELEDSDC